MNKVLKEEETINLNDLSVRYCHDTFINLFTLVSFVV